MTAKLPSYASYGPSGIPWSPLLPEHWGAERAKQLFTKMSRPVRTGDEVVTCFRDGTVTLRRNRRLRGFTEAIFESGYQGIRRGDLVIHAMDAFAGAVGVSDSEGKGTPVYSVCRPERGANPHYYAAVVREMARSQWIFALAKGIRERSTDFRFETFARQRVPRPPPEEQTAIVRYLSWATGRIDRAIRAKKKIVALLNEQRQAIIHKAVTSGLDPSVPMKESGVLWLGEIPAHWEQRSLWTISRLRRERNPGGLKLLSVFLDRGVIQYEEGGGQVHAPSLDLSQYQVVRVGDFVLNNQQAWRGSVGVSPHDGIISPAYIVLEMRGVLEQRFANYLLRSRCMVDQFVAASKGVGDIQRQVFWPFLRMVQVPVPPPEEQRRIEERVRQDTADIDARASRLDRQIALLGEYRTRLVADVVIGKLDVREAARRLPAESDPIPGDVDDSVGVEDEEAVA